MDLMERRSLTIASSILMLLLYHSNFVFLALGGGGGRGSDHSAFSRGAGAYAAKPLCSH